MSDQSNKPIYDQSNSDALRGKSGDKMRSLPGGALVCPGDEFVEESKPVRRGRSRKDAASSSQDESGDESGGVSKDEVKVEDGENHE